jgi:hypothetical protein
MLMLHFRSTGAHSNVLVASACSRLGQIKVPIREDRSMTGDFRTVSFMGDLQTVCNVVVLESDA